MKRGIDIRPERTVIDTCVWLRYFHEDGGGRELAGYVERAIPENNFLPTIVLYELYKKLFLLGGEMIAIRAVAHARSVSTVVPLDERLALEAAEISAGEGLAMADAIVMATARAKGATVVSFDKDLKGKPGVVSPE